jgi:hypothetical protein
LPPTVLFEAEPMTADFIFAQDVILDPDTGRILAVVRNGSVWRDGARIAVLVGAHMYDLNGNLLGKLAAGDGPLPISFKNLLEGKLANTRADVGGIAMPRATMERRKGKLTGHQAAECTVTISKVDGIESSRTITGVLPRVPDGDYVLSVIGEASTSRWRRDRNGWATESRATR